MLTREQKRELLRQQRLRELERALDRLDRVCGEGAALCREYLGMETWEISCAVRDLMAQVRQQSTQPETAPC